MPSNRTKSSEEMREETARFIIESGKSATSVAEEMGIDTNTVCRWVRDYRCSFI
jgi:transposase-like protein